MTELQEMMNDAELVNQVVNAEFIKNIGLLIFASVCSISIFCYSFWFKKRYCNNEDRSEDFSPIFSLLIASALLPTFGAINTACDVINCKVNPKQVALEKIAPFMPKKTEIKTKEQ